MSDLDTLLTADEDARAHLQAQRAALHGALETARAERDERRRNELNALEESLASELAAIAAGTEREIERRAAARRERAARLSAEAERLVEPAAALWARIVEEGSVP